MPASLNIPSSSTIVQVSIIDTTARIRDIPVSYFLGPEIKGLETFNCNAFAFLIRHIDANGEQRNIVFDLGPPKDYQHDLPQPTAQGIDTMFKNVKIDKYVSEILSENGVNLNDVEAVVWSHTHWDHIGNVSLFPTTTKLIIGPGIKEAHAPGYPENPSAPFLSREFKEREVQELNFNSSPLEIGDFQAIDYFNDGSFYFLSAPGHSTGHINALARTSSGSESTFILMGADSFHHPSQLRPSEKLPLPDSITFSPPSKLPNPCPGHLFNSIHPTSSIHEPSVPKQYQSYSQKYLNNAETTPFFTISQKPDGESIATDIEAARHTIRGLQAFDGDPNVFVIAAHDMTLQGTVDVFPHNANDWKKKGWKENGKWRFLEDLGAAIGATAKV